jgi:DNA-binding NtrC family response regulator
MPVLAWHFVKKYATRYGKEITQIGTAAMQAITAYPWPGNVRELEHMIERAVILTKGPILTIEELEREGATGAGNRLGMKRSTLQPRMKKLGITNPRRA